MMFYLSLTRFLGSHKRFEWSLKRKGIGEVLALLSGFLWPFKRFFLYKALVITEEVLVVFEDVLLVIEQFIGVL